MTDTDEITALRAENERLRAALEQIVRPGGADDFWQCYDIARVALEAERISEADGQTAPGKEEA